MITITIIIFLIFKWWWFSYGNERSDTFKFSAQLKWKQVKSIYHSNPNRWRFEKIIKPDYFTITTSTKYLLYDTGIGKIVRIRLSFIDYIKFLIAKTCSYGKDTEGLELILESVKKDIEHLSEMANEEIKSANKQIETIQTKIKKG